MAGGAAVGSADGSTMMVPSSVGDGAMAGADEGGKEEDVMVFKPLFVVLSSSSFKDIKGGGALPDGSKEAVTSSSSSTGAGAYTSSQSSSIDGPGAGVGPANSPNRSSPLSATASSFVASKMALDLCEILLEFWECHGSSFACMRDKVQQIRRRSVARLLPIAGGGGRRMELGRLLFTQRVLWD